jgi:hypothetical protein
VHLYYKRHNNCVGCVSMYYGCNITYLESFLYKGIVRLSMGMKESLHSLMDVLLVDGFV